jgi:hypothetical protein
MPYNVNITRLLYVKRHISGKTFITYSHNQKKFHKESKEKSYNVEFGELGYVHLINILLHILAVSFCKKSLKIPKG